MDSVQGGFGHQFPGILAQIWVEKTVSELPRHSSHIPRAASTGGR